MNDATTSRKPWDRYRRRFELTSLNPRGIFAIFYEKATGEERRQDWLPIPTMAYRAHDDEIGRIRAPILRVEALYPLGSEEAEIFAGDQYAPTFYMLESGEIIACYDCDSNCLDAGEDDRERRAVAGLDAATRRGHAFHEAGHLVAYMKVGIDVSWVEMGYEMDEFGTETFGRVMARTSEDLALDREEYLSGRIVSLLAGPMADARAAGEADWDSLRGLEKFGGRDDMDQAREAAGELAGGSKEAVLGCLEAMAARAKDLLEDAGHWKVVEEIADLLQQKRRVDAAPLMRIYRMATGGDDPAH